MKKLILWCVLLCSSQLCLALAPYVQGSKLAGADLPTHLAKLEQKLQAEGFTVIERHTPKGLSYELFIVGNKVYALYARYRIALAWPSLGMGQFMGIINAPEAIRNTLTRVAGGGAERSN